MEDKANPLKLTLPRLKRENQFIQWKESILSYLSTLHARVFVDYDVKPPIYIPETTQVKTGVTQAAVWRKLSPFYPADYQKYLTSLPFQVLTKVRDTEDVNGYHLGSENVPLK